MRNVLIRLWRKLTTIKAFMPIIFIIRRLAASRLFNWVLDFVEVNVCKVEYKEEKECFVKNESKIRDFINALKDDKSKKVYENLWHYRMTHQRKYIRGMTDKNQYFDKDLIALGENEVFVDCGAYKGDTISQFIKRVPNKKFDYIYAFEPDEYNYGCLEKYITKHKLQQKVKPVKKGTYDKEGKVGFLGNTEEGCKITESGNCAIEVDAIDNVTEGKNVTYIKMDVEGAELKSLEGAEKCIEKYHPRLAISIYHSPEDMINIPLYLKDKFPFYNFYVRHYTFFYADTVLYAMPNNNDALSGVKQ